MCTIGYHKKLNLLFKNRDKTSATNEVVIVQSDFLAVKTEGASYYSLGVKKNGCAFAGAAVNTPKWTALASMGKLDEAEAQFKNENKGLSSPIVILSKGLHNVHNINEWLDVLLSGNNNYMGYNILLADKERAAHVEVYRNDSHVTFIEGDAVITNHFQFLKHGPEKIDDYPSSFHRLDFSKKEVAEAISLEDIFQTLRTRDGEPERVLWRNGAFSTVSSSVVDIESCALYYCSDAKQGYARIATSIPPKGAEKVFIEMSRYIDLPTYHNIERGHPFYVEMIEEIEQQIKQYYDTVKDELGEDARLETLELGAGTGLCTLELIKYPFLQLDALEIDNECCKILDSHSEAENYGVILGDAVSYCKKHFYDLVVSTFAHDHIHYNKRFAFANNIYNNLKKGGLYIMGGEILPYYSNDYERKKALFKYHNYIIELALQHNRVQLAELENNALKSGLDMVGDFKRHEAMFEEEMISAGFTLIKREKIGPPDREDIGGVFVYIFKA